MPTLTLAEQAAEFTTTTHKDGEAADGEPTAEEQAAHASNLAVTAALKPADEDEEEAPVVEEEEEAEPTAEEIEAAKVAEAAAKAAGKTPEPKPAKQKDFNARLGEVTAARRQADRDAAAATARAEAAERELAELKSGKVPLTVASGADKSGAVAPDPSQFDYGELDPKYIAALARHEVAQERAEHRAEDEKTRQADAAAAKQREQVTKQDALTTAGIALHDDFDEVVMQGAKAGKWSLSPTLGELLLDSEFGPQIAYDLAKDPDEAARVFKLGATDQAKYLGRQEAKFEAAKSSQVSKTPKTPQAPPPPKTPKGGSGSNKIGADSSDFAAVEAAYRAGALR